MPFSSNLANTKASIGFLTQLFWLTWGTAGFCNGVQGQPGFSAAALSWAGVTSNSSTHRAINPTCSSDRGSPFRGIWGAFSPRSRWMSELELLFPGMTPGPPRDPPFNREATVSSTNPLWWFWMEWQVKQCCFRRGLMAVSN